MDKNIEGRDTKVQELKQDRNQKNEKLSETEKKVLQAIEQEIQDNILILVSNKVSMMENMNRVYVLVDGQIRASGTHKELLQTNEFYQELAKYEKEGEEY